MRTRGEKVITRYGNPDASIVCNRLRTCHVYLSLGDKEEKTRNPVMATVGDRIREASKLLMDQGINTKLEWNSGNHFRDADIRTAKAFAWVMKQ